MFFLTGMFEAHNLASFESVQSLKRYKMQTH